MLSHALDKASEAGSRLRLAAADALRLPVAGESVDVVTVAFGIRNFEDLERGLGELVRVLRPGGLLLVLEFSRPRGMLGPLLGWWVRTIPPRIGRMISGDVEAYSYLPASVDAFAEPERICAVLRRLGCDEVTVTSLTGGVCTLYDAKRSPSKKEAS
jgi:demethylmenaquinone methyltransferase/2-methoxy-6-polyprenyl-1,4-benzoquinol methylase